MRVWVDLTNSPHVSVTAAHEGRLRRLTDAADASLERRSEHGGLRIRRDPRELVRLLHSAADS
jgi:hypothetical protein